MGCLANAGHAEPTFLDAADAFQLKVEAPASPADALVLRWTIAPGYYLYRDRIEVASEPVGTAIEVDRPAGERKEDPSFGAVDVYHHQVALTVRSATSTALSVSWQGCAEAGLCYPPQRQVVSLRSTGAPPAAAAASPMSAWAQATAGNDGDVSSLLERLSLAWTVPLFFALGIALAFTPCVLPMVPILSSVVVGQGAGPRRALALSLAFVIPMAVTYAGLGVAAALAGENLQAWMQNRWTLFGMAGVFVVLATSMFGYFTLQLPQRLRNRLDGASRRQKSGTLLGASAMGFLSALLVGPCMTAPLAGTLLYIAQSGNAVQGGVLLLSLGLGMGVPLVLVATVGANCLPRPGVWMERVKGAFGFVLLGVAIWMVQRVVPPPVALALWGALLVALSTALVQLSRGRGAAAEAAAGTPHILAPAAAVLIGLWGSAMWLGAAAGGTDPWKPLAFVASARAPASMGLAASGAHRFESVDSPQALAVKLDAARAAGKPVLLDFYADWCVSCKTIETQVFGDPAVQRALDGAVLLRADVTANTPGQIALMRDHQVIGPPTVMLFDNRGQERREARLVGEFDASDLIGRKPGMREAL
ncbi:MAG: protein-disulfide reductase DsbD [Gammaproteobacteria bacterium]|nr:protein-disulfide reductase DsbD [Gammaproteobacteria bacterium]MBU1443550.1 protein-disulfide reductase DsbD [Gammaproteobacteria bacterium]MBU2287851.1 protein-disulfide reductase DsbD [Gammaproteobacteria bacterium]MBU2408015.1 protein-disulfide reductase DsbD [Gammaproteobacteria bacterium]